MHDYREFILNDKTKSYMNKDIVQIKCYYCGSIHNIRVGALKDRMKCLWLVERQICKAIECQKRKGADIIYYKQSIGLHPAQDHIVTQEAKDRIQETTHKNYPNGTQIHRKGKSFEEQYGEEKANQIKSYLSKFTTEFLKINGHPMQNRKHTIESKKKMSDASKKQMQEKGHPMQNKHHTEYSKLRMSESHIKFVNSEESYIKKYIHPKTGELLNWHEWNSISGALAWENKSEDERIAFSEKKAQQFLDRDGNYVMHSKTGYITHWFLEKDQKYDSSYEEAFFKKCNDEKLYWKKNLSIYIPYIHPIKKEKRFYVPDVLIYSDRNYKYIEKVVEIKPSRFVFNTKQYQGDYFKITKSKLDALKNYCLDNSYSYLIITENELGDYLENK